MNMSVLEILFIIGIVELLIIWVWFIIMGFQANKAWGFSMIFFSPITPFMYASRFARKARRAIYYYVVSLVALISLVLYIHFATIDFYTTFLTKLIPKEIITSTTPATNTEIPNNDQREIEVEIIGSTDHIEDEDENETDTETDINTETNTENETEQPEEKYKPQKRSYKVVDMKDMRLYLGKKVIITTSTKRHSGYLNSATSSALIIRKRLGGGSTTMPIKKNKIQKVEVYL